MSERPMVIVGAGQAGGRAALGLRAHGWTGPVALIGGEVHAPYERPPLSKAYLSGSAGQADFTFAAEEALREAEIEWHGGTHVSAIDRAAHRVELDSGASVPYERLLLATGRRPRALPVPGASLPGVSFLRDIDDAGRLAGQLRPGTRLVIVGGGFIGLEVAASAVAMGANVTVVEVGPRLLMRAVPEAMVEVLAERHRENGVALRLDTRVTGFLGEDRVTEVALSDGTRLPADAVVVGVGAVPRDELAREAGLAVDAGIVVDETLATEDPDVFAAGDVCAYPHPLGGGLLRLEAWQNANDQGEHAARSMLGEAEPYRAVPWFWSDQYDLVLQMAGFPDRGATVVERDAGGQARLQFYLDDTGRLVGASGVGPTSISKDVRIGQKLIERGAHPSAETLADPSVKLKALLKSAA